MVLPWVLPLKLKDWNPPVSTEASIASTPHSLWLRLYSVTMTMSITTVTAPPPRPEYKATSLLTSASADGQIQEGK